MTQLPERKDFGDYGEWPGKAVLDPSGERLGEVREIYLDDATDRPEWVLVERDGRDPRFVPLADAHVEADTIRVAQSSARIEAAPSLEPSKPLTLDEERELYSHYGVQLGESGSDSTVPAADDTADSGHRDTPGAPGGDAAPEETATAPTGGPADESGRDDTASGGLGLSTAAGESAGGAEALTGDRAGDESAAAAGMAMAAGGTAGTGGPASGAQAPAGAGGTTAPSEA